MRIERLALSEWTDVLPDTGLEVFHRPEAIKVLSDHVPGELHLFGGFKGKEPVGLFPVHIRSKFGARIITSPPLGFGIGRLGPILMPSSPKQRKQESANRRFIQEVVEELDAQNQRTLVRLACSTEYTDPRPFQWGGFDITPAFTYRVNVGESNTQELLQSFSRDLRADIRKQEESGISIRLSGMEGARKTFDSIRDRCKEQGFDLPLTWNFVRDLIDTLGERARVYVAESSDGMFLSGMIILYANGTAYNWKGGAKTDRTVSPNTLLHWRVMEDLVSDSTLKPIVYYDLYTANNERLARYKSGFGGAPEVYYLVETDGITTSVGKAIYRMTALGKHPLEKESPV